MEMLKWMGYERATGPLGPVRGDYWAALVCKVFADVNAPKKSKRTKFESFLFKWGVTKSRGERQQQGDDPGRHSPWEDLEGLGEGKRSA